MKKNVIRVVALIIAVLLLVGTLGSVINLVRAESLDINKGVYVYGAGLSQEEAEETKTLLGIKDKNIGYIKIKGEDSLKYINENNNDSQMISSIFAKKNNDDVVRVEVMTPLMITDVSSLQYSNAAITAGVKGLDIKVASVTQVTGTSALTGVYKLMEVLGQEVDTERTKAANEEIETINVIAKEHKDDENFNKEDLNKAVVEGKQQLINIKESDGNVVAEQVENVTNTVIKDNNLQNVLNNNDIQNLIIMFTNFINIENLNINETKDQLNYLKENVANLAKEELKKVKEFIDTDAGKEFINNLQGSLTKENLEELLNNAKEGLNSKEVQDALNGIRENLNTENIKNYIDDISSQLGNDAGGFFNSITNFFSNIFESIVNFFSNLFN
ncbi:DUF1002 domain-containing protein [Helcococcus sueciensis]|uniref:DUF1002 domain-containing protein n=1 Tax=Helcococcus sueciensis TaxID=241555 RepID=UPI0004020A48|nr:DUF1002 domain-containing protein [Helcococcus sueciensis]